MVIIIRKKKSLTYASSSSLEEPVAYATDKSSNVVNIIINSSVKRTETPKEFQLNWEACDPEAVLYIIVPYVTAGVFSIKKNNDANAKQ